MTESEKATLIIDELRLVDKQMLNTCYNERPDKTITFEQCKELWNETVWHDIIVKRIQIFQQYL